MTCTTELEGPLFGVLFALVEVVPALTVECAVQSARAFWKQRGQALQSLAVGTDQCRPVAKLSASQNTACTDDLYHLWP